MAYLPPSSEITNAFPLNGVDLTFQARLILEQFARNHPAISYYSLNSGNTQVNDDVSPENVPAVAAGNTAFDNLYGEPVDPDMAGGPWQQPHTEGFKTNTDDTEQFATPVTVYARFMLEDLDKTRKKYGFNLIRDAIVTIPTKALDDATITSKPGDKLLWGAEYYMIDEMTFPKWYNTNVPLYGVFNCSRRKVGA